MKSFGVDGAFKEMNDMYVMYRTVKLWIQIALSSL